MKRILVLGAGQSTPYLIAYLLKESKNHDWFVTVGDINHERARQRIGNHPCGNAIFFDVNDAVLRTTQIKKSDIVINMLAPRFQYLIALECIHHRKHMISASYEDIRVRDLDKDANRSRILILNEMGLDPGIDHMSAMFITQKIKNEGGIITSFESYGSGLPAPEASINPLRYCITWNPRNVVMAGEEGAQYMENKMIKILPFQNVFQRTWSVDVEGIGMMEAYPNRDSLVYKEIFKLNEVHTMIRGTLRYPGWSETWHQIVRLGLPNETLRIPGLKQRTYREFLEMFLPINISGSDLEHQVANFLNINPTGKIMENLKWLGLFSAEPIGVEVKTAADVLIHLLQKKLRLPPGTRDMVVIIHKIGAVYPEKNNQKEEITSTLVEFGEAKGFTAISKTVGLPAGIAAKLLLTGQLPLSGCHIPTHPAIYQPVLENLHKMGIKFKEKRGTTSEGN